MAVKFINLVDNIIENPLTLVASYNNMTDSTKVAQTNVLEMRQILYWSFAAMHRLHNLEWLDDNGDTSDVITTDMTTDFAAVLNHNIVLLVNNWRQTQFFQNDNNGKTIMETKFNPIDNTSKDTQGYPTNSANVAYSLFDINIQADKNLSQVCQLLIDIYHDFRQHLKGVVAR